MNTQLLSAHQPRQLLYTIAETKQALRIGHTKTYELINRGVLEVVKIDGGTRVTGASIERLASEGTSAASRQA